ncbi:ATP-dependent DNA helicase DinG [Escherichia coli]|nr:ATP-dependent DNA helicase DinG [Escherichia coli]
MLLVQGDQPRYRLVELHRKRVANGERSVLVGLQSFAEGLDLKGDLLSQVHIHKIAFSAHRQPGGDHRRGMAEKPQPLSV